MNPELSSNSEKEDQQVEAYWKHKEIKSCAKLVNKCSSKFIPTNHKVTLLQSVADITLNSLPDDVLVFEMIPEVIYSKKLYGQGKDLWTPENINTYLEDLTKIMHPNLMKKSRKEKFYVKDIEQNENDTYRELKSYYNIYKCCKESYITLEQKEHIYSTLSDIMLESCPKNVKIFKIYNEIFSKRDIGRGETWDILDYKKYIKDIAKK